MATAESSDYKTFIFGLNSMLHIKVNEKNIFNKINTQVS